MTTNRVNEVERFFARFSLGAYELHPATRDAITRIGSELRTALDSVRTQISVKRREAGRAALLILNDPDDPDFQQALNALQRMYDRAVERQTKELVIAANVAAEHAIRHHAPGRERFLSEKLGPTAAAALITGTASADMGPDYYL